MLRGLIRIELFVRKIFGRAYPLDPEIIFYRRLGKHKGKSRLILKTRKAWALHPLTKPNEYLALLDEIINKIDLGLFPEGQSQNEDILVSEWYRYLTQK